MTPLSGRWHEVRPGGYSRPHPQRPWIVSDPTEGSAFARLDLVTGEEVILGPRHPYKLQGAAWIGDHLAVFNPEGKRLEVMEGNGNGSLLSQKYPKVTGLRSFSQNQVSLDLWVQRVNKLWLGVALVAGGDEVSLVGPWQLRATFAPAFHPDLAMAALFRRARAGQPSLLEVTDGRDSTHYPFPTTDSIRGENLHWIGPHTLVLIDHYGKRLDLRRITLDGPPPHVDVLVGPEDALGREPLFSPDRRHIAIAFRDFELGQSSVCVIDLEAPTIQLQQVAQTVVRRYFDIHWLDTKTLGVWETGEPPTLREARFEVVDAQTLAVETYTLPDVDAQTDLFFEGSTHGCAVFHQSWPLSRVFVSDPLVTLR